MMQAAHDNDIDLEGKGELQCDCIISPSISFCHFKAVSYRLACASDFHVAFEPSFSVFSTQQALARARWLVPRAMSSSW